MTRFRTYAAPVGASDSHAVELARQYAASVGNRAERSEWAARVAALVVRDVAKTADVLICQYRDAVSVEDVDAIGAIVGDVNRCAVGLSPRVTDMWQYRGAAWLGAVTRWTGLMDAARHAGALEFRARFAAAVLDMPDTAVSVPGAAWTRSMEVQQYGPTHAWEVYADSLRTLETRASDVYRALGVTACVRCDRCGPVDVDGGFCRDCARFFADCVVCGDTVDTSDAVGFDGDTWCESCSAEHLESCAECGTWSDPESEPRCNCANACVNSYGYKPAPVFRSVVGDEVVTSWHAPTVSAGKTMRAALVLGVEIEMECAGGGYAAGLRTLSDAAWIGADFAYLKSDGSLCDGVELVTHPATVDAWRRLVDDYEELGEQMTGHGWEATDNCGIHVHANRAAFSGVAHTARHGVLWHSWRDDLVPICGRESSTYASWSAEGKARVAAYAAGLAHSPRYSPINYQPSATVEVRCFASTLEVDVLAGLIELVGASVEFSRVVTSADILAGRAAWESFVSFMESEHYRSANALVMARGGN